MIEAHAGISVGFLLCAHPSLHGNFMDQRQKNRIDHAARVAVVIQDLRLGGISDPAEIASALNARGISDVRGRAWTLLEVLRFDKRPKERKVPLKRAEWTQLSNPNRITNT
ncbi:hypothetical protein QA634_14230 [Methylobacterium sp. CB376]|uniref:hypothetical protein n=1 Tax=unclassified Methylobacterium TaxID=2615210 RepID=UPI0012378D48|nr:MULTISPECIES: hypothetical protein [Methylobacterium]WFT82923.1 hypothetical protein QA634_14230 [Methylobacterium nodulans]